MTVQKYAADRLAVDLIRVRDELSVGKDRQKAVSSIETAISVFTSQVSADGILITGTSEELVSLADEYLQMLSQRHIAAFVQIGMGSPIEVYRTVKQMMKKYCEFFVIVPVSVYEDTIRIGTAFFSEKDERYDLELFPRAFCS